MTRIVKKMFNAVLDPAISGVTSLLVRAEGVLLKTDGCFKLAGAAKTYNGDIRKMVPEGKCILAVLGAGGSLLSPPSTPFPSESSVAYNAFMAPLMETMRENDVTPRAIVIDSAIAFKKCLVDIVKETFPDSEPEVLPDVFHRFLQIISKARKLHFDFSDFFKDLKETVFSWSKDAYEPLAATDSNDNVFDDSVSDDLQFLVAGNKSPQAPTYRKFQGISHRLIEIPPLHSRLFHAGEKR